MTFLNVYESLPVLAETGKERIRHAIDHVDKMRQTAETDEDKQQADEAIKGALNRIADIDTMVRRLQANIHLLAMTCYDGSISVRRDDDETLL